MDHRGFNIIPRTEWKAKRCTGFDTPQEALEAVVVYYNTETRRCDSRKDCCLVVKQIQQVHQKLGLADLHFNFLIGADGNVYEGRGWNRFPSKCVRNRDLDDKSYAVAYIGDWSNEPLKKEMVDGFLSLMQLGIWKKKILGGYKVYEEREPLPLISKPTKPRKERVKLTFNIKSVDHRRYQHPTKSFDPLIARQFIPAKILDPLLEIAKADGYVIE